MSHTTMATGAVPVPHCDHCAPEFECWGNRYAMCHKHPPVAESGRSLGELVSENAKLREQCAQQLAACDCAAMMDTAETHAKVVIDRTNPFWSPAYESVMRRTSECIRLREALEEQRGFWQTMLPDPTAHKAITRIDQCLP